MINCNLLRSCTAEVVAHELIGCLLVKQQMLSKMAIRSEVFGRCVGEKMYGWRWEIVPGIGGSFYALGVIEELKSTCGGRGLWS